MSTRITRTARPTPEPVPAIPPLSNGDTLVLHIEADSEGGSKVDYVQVIARYKAKVTNRSSAIRAKCVECSGGMLSEVRECRVVACALHPYRLGVDPNNKKTLDRLAKQNQSTEEEE